MRFKLLMGLVMLGLSMMAAPADPTPARVTQPDGSVLTLKLIGDEFYHFNTTIDGYTLLRNATGAYEYAVSRNRRLVASGVLAHDPAERSAADLAALEATPRYLTDPAAQGAAKVRRDQTREQAPMRLTTQGFRGLVVLINYTDKKFQMANPATFYEQMICQRDYTGFTWNGRKQNCPGSFRDYFNDQSFGQFDPVFDIAGPVEVDFSCTDPQSTENAWRIFFAALDALDPTVDFSRYDNDGDGNIDMVYFIVAGYSANYSGNDSGYLWPHKSYLYDHEENVFRRYDRVAMMLYASSTEIYGWESQGSTMPLGIGTMCHEFSHVLGLPDLYDTDYATNGQSNHPDDWDVMAGGSSYNYGRMPCNYSIWERYALGWATPVEITAAGSYSMSAVGNEGEGFIIRTPVNNEFFMLDNRQRTGWDAALPGHGMLVARIDSTNPEAWYRNEVNARPSHNYYELVRAGKGAGNASDPFPGSQNVTSLTNFTDPALTTWAGLNNDFSIVNITESNGIIHFDIIEAEKPNSVTEDFERMAVTTDKNLANVAGTASTWTFKNAHVVDVIDKFGNGEHMCALYKGGAITTTKPLPYEVFSVSFNIYNKANTTAKFVLYRSTDGSTWSKVNNTTFDVDGNSSATFYEVFTTTEPMYYRIGLSAGGNSVPAYIDDVTFSYFNEFTVATTGDINNDGKVDVEDLNILINGVLSGNSTPAAMDIDGDGKVDVQDINLLVNLILGN